MPRVIMLLLVEPTKPRLCHDERFLNLWMKDTPFKLDKFKDVHHMVDLSASMICCNEKSGYYVPDIFWLTICMLGLYIYYTSIRVEDIPIHLSNN